MKQSSSSTVETIAAALRLTYWRLRSVVAAAMTFPFMASPARCVLRPRTSDDTDDTAAAAPPTGR